MGEGKGIMNENRREKRKFLSDLPAKRNRGGKRMYIEKSFDLTRAQSIHH